MGRPKHFSKTIREILETVPNTLKKEDLEKELKKYGYTLKDFKDYFLSLAI